MGIELFDHDWSLADVAGFGSGAAYVFVFLLGVEGDLGFAVLTNDGSFRTLLFVGF